MLIANLITAVQIQAETDQVSEATTTDGPEPPHKDAVVNIGSINVDGHKDDPDSKVTVTGTDCTADVDAYGTITVKASYYVRGRPFTLWVTSFASIGGSGGITYENAIVHEDEIESGEFSVDFPGVCCGETLVVTLKGYYEDYLCSRVTKSVEVTIHVDDFTMDNNPPSKPEIQGPNTAKSAQSVTFSATSTDPDTIDGWTDPITYHWSSSNDCHANIQKQSGEPSSYSTTFTVTKETTHSVSCSASDRPYLTQYGRTSKSSEVDWHYLTVTFSKNSTSTTDINVANENASPSPSPTPTSIPSPQDPFVDLTENDENNFNEETVDDNTEEGSSNNNSDDNSDDDSTNDSTDDSEDSSEDEEDEEDGEESGSAPEQTETEGGGTSAL